MILTQPLLQGDYKSIEGGFGGFSFATLEGSGQGIGVVVSSPTFVRREFVF